MLSQTEKEGCRQILKRVTEGELLSLKDTVTKRQIITNDKAETIDAIITYTERAVELLKRKKVKRDILFQYLAENKVVENPSAEKHELIRRILTFWGSSFSSLEIRESASRESLTSADSSSTTIQRGTREIQGASDGNGYGTRYSSLLPPRNVRQAEADSTVVVRSSSSVENPSREPTGNVSRKNSVDERFVLGKQFVEWFYKILNSHNPSLQDIPDAEFGPQHFWSDCRLEMKLDIQGDVKTDQYEGAMLVAHRFLALVKEERLLFNPNVSMEGIRVKSEPHGLILVMTCGTLHRVNDCLGVFEQIFGLVSDPALDSNWKVKMSQLKMRSSQQTAMPKLDNCDQTLAIHYTE